MNLKNFIHETISEYLLLELTADEIKQKYYPNIEQDIFDSIFKSDKISSNYERGKLGMYAKWLLKLYINNKLDINKLDTIQNYISIFDRLSKSNRLEIKDINRYNSIEDMYQVVEPYLDTNKPISNREIREQDTRKVFEDSRFLVVQPLTMESSIRYGKGTKWCTASTDVNNEFDNYNREGKLYIIMDKTKRNSKTGDYEKYQIHFESGQLMYSDNRAIDFDKNLEIVDAIKKIVMVEKIDDVTLVKMNLDYIMFIENPSEQVQLEAVKRNGYAIEFIFKKGITPSEQVQLEAVKEDGNAIRYIANPSEQVQLEAVKRNGHAIEFIFKKGITPSEQVQLEAVKEDGYAIEYIVNPTEQVQLEAVKRNGYAIKYIVNPTEQVQLEVVKRNRHAIEFIFKKGITPSEQVQLEAVKRNGYAIEYIDNPSEQVQLEAVKQNGVAIGFIFKKGITPSEQVQLEAVKEDGYAIEYIDNPSEQVQLEAVKEDGYAIQYIVNPSEQVQLEAVKRDGHAIEFIFKKGITPSEQVQLEAVKRNGYAIKYIVNPTEQVQLEAVKEDGYAIQYIVNPSDTVIRASKGE